MSVREPQYLTLLQLCNDVLRRFGTVVAMVVVCAAGSALVALARPRTYTSIASFVAEAREPLSAELSSGSSLDMLPGPGPGPGQRGGASRMTRMLATGG